MADTLSDLLVRLDADSARFRSEIDKAGERLESLGAKVDALVDKASKGLAIEAARAAEEFASKALAASRAIFEFAKAGGEAAEKMTHFSEVTGIATEQLADLEFAAKKIGTGSDSVSTAMAKLERQMAAAAGGNREVALAFKAMGIELESAPGKLRPVGDVLEDLGKKVAGYQAGAARTALVQQTMGRGAAELVPFLQRLGEQGFAGLRREAEAFGATLDSRTIAKAADFKEQINKVEAGVDSLRVKIAAQLDPTLVTLADHFQNAAKKGGEFQFWMEASDTVLKTFATALEYTLTKVEILGKGIGAAAAAGAAILSADLDGAKGAWAEYTADVDRANFDAAQRIAKIWEFEKGLGGGIAPPGSGGKPPPIVDSKADEAVRSLKASLSELQGQIQALKATGAGDVLPNLTRLTKEALGPELITQWREKFREAQTSFIELEQKISKGAIAEHLEKAGKKAGDLASQFHLSALTLDDLKEKLAIFQIGERGAKGLDDELRKLHEKTLQLSSATELQAVRWEISNGKLHDYVAAMQLAGKSTDEIIAKIERVAIANDRLKVALEGLNQGFDRYRDLNARATQIVESQITSTERFTEQLGELKEMKERGMLTSGQYGVALVKLAGDFSGLGDVAKRAIDGLSDAIAQLVVDGGKNFDEIAARFARMVEMMLAKAIAAKIISVIIETIGSAFGGIGGKVVGGAAGGAAGSALGEAVGGAAMMAGGGFATAGQPLIVGEKGPELFMPSSNGSILPNHELSALALAGPDAFGGGTTVNQVSVPLNSAVPYSFTEVQRHLDDQLIPALERAAERGRLDRIRRMLLRL